MGSIISTLTGGSGGVNYSPTAATLQTPTTSDQAAASYVGAQNGLNQQQALVQALQNQNGLGNQSSTYNQLQGVANGTGPNPAQAQLAQATGANVANQAALMAGQRGTNANAGLLARQAAQQGAATQQGAAGQAATLQANQSLNALGQMGSLATSQANNQANATNAYTNAAQNEQNNLLNSINAQNSAAVGNQSNVNSVSGQLAGGAQSGQFGLAGGLLNSAGSLGSLFGGSSSAAAPAAAGSSLVGGGTTAGGNLLGTSLTFAQGGRIPMADGGNTSAQPAQSFIPTGTTPLVAATGATSSPQAGPQSALGQSLSDSQGANNANYSAGSSVGSGLGSAAGLVSKMAPGLASNLSGLSSTIGNGLTSAGQGIGDFFSGMTMGDISSALSSSGLASVGPDIGEGAVAVGGASEAAAPAVAAAAKGGKVPVLLSPGEKKLTPQAVQAVKQGANPMAVGETVPGKPKVGGAKNDYANDTVPDNAEPGTIILPRSVTQSKNPQWAAHKFVVEHMAKGGLIGHPLAKSKKKAKK